MSDREKEILEIKMPEYLREDILEFIRLRNIVRNDETTINIVHLKVHFETLMSSLKCAVIEGTIRKTDMDEIRNECSYW